MSSNHMKRLAMPRSWPITRKTNIWVSRPNPGAHSLELCIPVGVVIRDILQFANTMREVRYILQAGKVSVDGKTIKDTRRGVGLMDVLTLGDNNYRCVLDHNGKLRYSAISKDEAGWKICRIEGKPPSKAEKLNSIFMMEETFLLTMQVNTRLETHSNWVYQNKRSSNTSTSVRVQDVTSLVVCTLVQQQT